MTFLFAWMLLDMLEREVAKDTEKAGCYMGDTMSKEPR
jgi:hypothetical protein